MGLRDALARKAINWTCGAAPITAERARLVPLATGRVLEVGIGSGLNLPHYDRGLVSAIVGVDPDRVATEDARRRADVHGLALEVVNTSAETLAVDGGSIDTVVTTFSLCSIPDARAALAEVRRVLKPDGRLLFLEHGRAPDPGVAWLQRRLTPLWRRVMGGCRLDGDVPALLEAAGFHIETVEAKYAAGFPRFVGYGYRGVGRVLLG